MQSPLSQPLLLSLPTELRLEIYKHLAKPIQVPPNHLLPRPTFSTQSTALNILLTCKQLHHEAREILFTHHTFIFTRDLSKNPLPLPVPVPTALVSTAHPYTLTTSILIPTHHPSIFPIHEISYDPDVPPYRPDSSPAIPPYTTNSTYTFMFRDIDILCQSLPHLRSIIFVLYRRRTHLQVTTYVKKHAAWVRMWMDRGWLGGGRVQAMYTRPSSLGFWGLELDVGGRGYGVDAERTRVVSVVNCLLEDCLVES